VEVTLPSIVLRASAPSFDVDTFLSEFPFLDPDFVWRAGDELRSGRADTSGFNACLAESDDTSAALAELRDQLADLEPAIRALISRGVSCELDIGLFVGFQTPRWIELPPTDLAHLASLGLFLCVSAYPCSDEEDDD
jgi:hypothetical protein